MTKEISVRQYDDMSGEPANVRIFSWNSPRWKVLPLYCRCGTVSLRRGKCHCFHYFYGKAALELVISGSMHYRFGKREMILHPGDIALFRHGSNCGFYNFESDCVERCVLIIEGEMRDAVLHYLSLDKCDVIKVDDTERVRKLFAGIHQELSQKSPGGEDRISSMLYALLLDLSRFVPANSSAALPPGLLEILRYLELNLHLPLSLNQIALAHSMSVPSLQRLFKKHLGISPAAYLLNLRLECAADLLLAENVSVKEIAWRCGFENPLYFSTVFRRYKGVSPRKYRQSAE